LHSKIFKMYPEQIVKPMKAVLTDNGFAELTTNEEVDEAISEEGTALVVINSVCGCSAGTARPGVLHAIETSSKRPDRLTTSFAGFDIEAVDHIRQHSIALPSFVPSYCII
jgi:putative YphP/YqiW family bacilliredoxin